MNSEAKVITIVGILFVAIFGAAFFLISKNTTPAAQVVPEQKTSLLVREDSHATHPAAKVAMVEFGDFQCPACATVFPIIQDVKDKYGEQINFVFRNFPLDQHPYGKISSQAAEAAGLQDRFWEMYEVLYERQNEWSTNSNPESVFAGYAEDLGLNVDKFKSDLKSDEVIARVNKDRQDGLAIGINATPTVFVNGEKVDNLNNLSEVIDRKLSQ